MVRKLDVANWKRQPHFELYRRFAQPFFSVCADVDVTRIWEQCRGDRSISFTLRSLYHGSRAANSVEALRMRIRGDDVWVHDVVHFGTTVLRPDNTFAFARIESSESLHEFAKAGRDVLERARTSTVLDTEDKDDDLIYHSILPWVRFTAFSNAIRGHDDSFPRIVYGKVTESGKRWVMPVGIEVHHGLVDGYDAGMFFESFQAELSQTISF